MYSRNQGRESKLREAEGMEFYDDISDEEYEIYKYNLPPKYDGSRFRRNRQKGRRLEPEVPPENYEIVTERDAETEPVGENMSESEPCGELGDNVTETDTPVDREEECLPQKLDKQSHLPRILSDIGYEELLIIALILAIAGGDNGGDVLLLLAVLLTQK